MQLTDRQQEIKTYLDQGMGAREIAEKLGITRNAVYQQIQRMRRYGVLATGWTPSGQPAREDQPGADVLERLLVGTSDGDGASSAMRALAVELRRTRDELDVITRRLSEILPR